MPRAAHPSHPISGDDHGESHSQPSIHAAHRPDDGHLGGAQWGDQYGGAVDTHGEAYDQSGYVAEEHSAPSGDVQAPHYPLDQYQPSDGQSEYTDDPQYLEGSYGQLSYDQSEYSEGAYDQSQHQQQYQDGAYQEQAVAYDQQQNQDGSYDQSGYDNTAHEQQQYQDGSYDQSGYDSTAYDQQQYQDGSYEQSGYDNTAYDQQQYQDGSYDQSGYDNTAYDQQQYQDGSYDQSGYDNTAYDQQQYQDGSYDQSGYDNTAYGQQQYQDGSYDQSGYDNSAYDQQPQQYEQYSQSGFSSMPQAPSGSQYEQPPGPPPAANGYGDVHQRTSADRVPSLPAAVARTHDTKRRSTVGSHAGDMGAKVCSCNMRRAVSFLVTRDVNGWNAFAPVMSSSWCHVNIIGCNAGCARGMGN
jgi:hypothetical protein